MNQYPEPTVSIRDQSESLVAHYSRLIRQAIETACVKRIEEIEGRVPSVDEIKEHGAKHICPETQTTLYLWRGIPIVEYQAASHTAEGWRDCVVSEIRPVTEPQS